MTTNSPVAGVRMVLLASLMASFTWCLPAAAQSGANRNRPKSSGPPAVAKKPSPPTSTPAPTTGRTTPRGEAPEDVDLPPDAADADNNPGDAENGEPMPGRRLLNLR